MKLFFCFIGLLFVIDSFAQTISTNSSHAEVKGKSPGKNYVGVSDKLQGKVDISSGELQFKLPIESIDTGIKKRNQHMNQALETEKFPNAEFKGNLVSPVNMTDKSVQQNTVKGEFTIHGQSKSIEVPVTITPTEEGLKFSGEWSILITEYGIKRPQFGFIKVKDLHTISVSGELK